MLDKSDKEFINESIENAVAQISGAMVKALEGVATKEDLVGVKEEMRGLKTEVRHMRNDTNDLKADTPTAKEFKLRSSLKFPRCKGDSTYEVESFYFLNNFLKSGGVVLDNFGQYFPV